MDLEVLEFLTNDWREAGFDLGDMVLVHTRFSGVRRRIKQELDKVVTPEEVAQSFINAVGQDGTVLFPLFNFDFTEGVTFDIQNTPSKMGAISEAGRLVGSPVRTGHPIYSFAVHGSKKHLFKNVNNFSGYGADSPFSILHEHGGKIGVLGLQDQNSMTFYHYVEEHLEVDYRYHKTFTGNYIDNDGMKSERTCGLFVRDIENEVLTDVNRMGERLWEKGLYQGSRLDEGSGFRTIAASELFKETAQVINSGQAVDYLYSIGTRHG